MKKVLYITNIAVPYRVCFFNELAKYCHLTVLYESRNSQQRDKVWANSQQPHHRVCYFGKDLLHILRERYDAIILGCYQTPLQILAGLFLRLRGIPFLINLDGEPFLEGNSLKARCKRILLSGGAGYLAAGEKAARSLKKVAGSKPITPYYFSSLTEGEIHREAPAAQRSDIILVVGQYFPYKGMDVALEAARMDASLRYRFVGMGSRTAEFARKQEIPENVELIPFLQKEALFAQLEVCSMLVLPSRRECWGLVINEAASRGTPIVSTWGCGAAVEFLPEDYPQFLAQPGDGTSLLACIRSCLALDDKTAYGEFLRKKAGGYSIERSVQAHLNALEGKLP